nr:hypothetical protein [Tanacetum cinerariifolium]
MRIDELYKFSDGTLNDVRNALDDRLKGIRMQYLPTTIWRRGDKDRAAAMIQAIDKMLKTRRIMRSLESLLESALDVYSKRRIIDVTELKIVEWHSYKHLDWISVRCDDDNIYKFKEDDFKRLRLQDIEDMLLLLDKKNRLMRIDELHKFNDVTLNDVRNALDDRLKGIRMQYLLSTIWRRGDKDRAATMIQAIKKMLKTKRIMRSLEKFVGGRLYEGDFRMLQRTI